MGNEVRVKKEIQAAVKRLAIADLPADVVEKVAIECVSIETAHGHSQVNINQQFDRLVRELGALLGSEEGNVP